MVKKLGIVLGAFLAVVIALMVIVPLVVDVDKYRPQIVEAANRQINGKLDLGRLSLSLWGQIRIDVGGLSLKDAKDKEIVGVKDAYFHLPFFSILSGSPVLTFKMNHPNVSVIKNKAGQLNVMSLMKPSQSVSDSQKGNAQTTTPSGGSNGPVALPGIVARARLGIELRSALVSYKDEISGITTDVKDLNFIMKDISLSHPMDLELWADLDTKVGNTFLLTGPAQLTGKAQPSLKDGKFDHIALNARLDMDSVEMRAPGLFEKKKGLPTHLELAVIASDQEIKIEKLLARFFNAEVNVEGNVTQLASGAAEPSSPIVNLNVKSNEIQFKPWVELVPLLKAYELGGSARLDADARGPSQKLNYHAKLVIKDLTAKAPQLKVQPKIDGEINVITDQIESALLTLKAPGNDLKMKGKIVSFSQPRASFEISSTGMDLDQLMDFSQSTSPAPKAGAESTTTSPAKTGKPATGAAAVADNDALLAPLRENAFLLNTSANLALNMAMVKAQGTKVTDIACKLSFKDLGMGLEKCGLKIFSGTIKTDALVQFKPKTPNYRFSAKIDGLNLGQAVESQMALFKNTVTGIAHFSLSGEGSSFNPDPAMTNLKATGKFKVDQAAFATIDVMKMVSEGLNKTLDQIGDKIPPLKGKSLGKLPNTSSKYEFISSDFSISGGKFAAPNFYAKAAPNQGIDLKGSTVIGLKDKSLDTKWDIIDTYNMTHARDLSIEQNGVKVEHILAEGNSPVHFPVHAGCTLVAPCYSYTEVPAFLGKVALNNVTAAMGNRAKEEVKKQAESLIKKAAPGLENKLKGLFR